MEVKYSTARSRLRAPSHYLQYQSQLRDAVKTAVPTRACNICFLPVVSDGEHES